MEHKPCIYQQGVMPTCAFCDVWSLDSKSPLVLFQEHLGRAWNQLVANMVSNGDSTSPFSHAISQATVSVGFHT